MSAAPPHRRSIAVFGGADVPRTDPQFEAAADLGAALAGAGYQVLTGGYSGLMEAASEGARRAGGQVLGVTVASFDPKPANDHVTQRLHARDLHDRIRHMLRESSGVVVLPGGLGTLTETTTAWLLKQVGQLPDSFPIIVLDPALFSILNRAATNLLIAPADLGHLNLARDHAEVLRLLDAAARVHPTTAPVTIGIAAWNASAYIGAAIASALSQTVEPVEVIVVDDGSDDDTRALIEQWRAKDNRVTLISQSNLGTPSALNRVIASCSTRYLLGLDSDDLLTPQAVERFWEAATRHPGAALIYSDHIVIDASGTEVARRSSAEPADLLRRLQQLHDNLALDNTDNFLPAGHARLYDVERVASIGGYASDLRYAEDFDLVLRMAERWDCAHVPEPLYQYRWHTTNKGIWGRQGQLDDVRESYRRHRWRAETA